MSHSMPNQPVLDLSVVALPTLCCLLAGIIWVAADRGPMRQRALPRSFQEQLESAEAAAASTTRSYEQFTIRLERFENSLGGVNQVKRQLALLAGLIARAEQRITELLKAKAELGKQMEPHEKRKAQIAEAHELLRKLREENEAARRRIEGLKKPGSDDVPTIPGVSYKGPYVLVECLERGLVVYPARRSLGATPSPADFSWLLAEGERVGFIALAVRANAFNTTLERLYWPLRQRLEAAAKEGKKIGFAYFPIEVGESIARYLPKGASR